MYFVHVIPLIRGMTKFNNNYRKMHLLKLLIQRGKTPPPSLNGEYPPPPLPRLPIYHEDLLGQDKWLPYKGELDQNTRILFVIYKNMTCPVYWKRKYTVHGTFLNIMAFHIQRREDYSTNSVDILAAFSRKFCITVSLFHSYCYSFFAK
jgi:hypothetical protein